MSTPQVDALFDFLRHCHVNDLFVHTLQNALLERDMKHWHIDDLHVHKLRSSTCGTFLVYSKV